MTEAPNIFDYATGELSQDAFLAWIAKWADPKYASCDAALNTVAQNLVAEFCEDQIRTSDIQNINVYLQYPVKPQDSKRSLKTDVLIDVTMASETSNHLILIEDKTGTGAREGQLKAYKDGISRDPNFKSHAHHYIYFKTHDHLTYKLHGFRDFRRRRVLEVLDTASTKDISNQIFQDYVSRLRRMEKSSQEYLTKNNWETEWGYDQWTGFLMALCRKLQRPNQSEYAPNFGYVHNSRGGFIGAWFDSLKMPGINLERGHLYLQIEAYSSVDANLKNNSDLKKGHFILTLRIGTESREKTAELRDLLLKPLKDKFEAAGIEICTKNLRVGRSMRLMVFENISIESTAEKVESLAKVIRHISEVIIK